MGAHTAVGGTLGAADRTGPDLRESIDEVIDHVAGRANPLALYIYSKNQHAIDCILSRTSSGGVNQSGMGSFLNNGYS